MTDMTGAPEATGAREAFLLHLESLLKGHLTVSRETGIRFQQYHDLLVKWQKVQNLVAPNTLKDIWFRHFLDSAQLMPYLLARENAVGGRTLVDFGSGAGFPGMVLALLIPESQAFNIHLVEANSRKCAFLKDVARTVRVNVEIHNCRIEDFANQSTIQTVDFVTARALKPLPRLLDLGHFAFKEGAVGLFLKGKTALEEIIEAQKMWEFQLDSFESCTETEARIVQITNVKPRR